MNRQILLGEITGLMGDVLASLEADGMPLDHRSIRLFIDGFCDRYKALPAPDVAARTKALLASIHMDEERHGGLLSIGTMRMANELRLLIEPR